MFNSPYYEIKHFFICSCVHHTSPFEFAVSIETMTYETVHTGVRRVFWGGLLHPKMLDLAEK